MTADVKYTVKYHARPIKKVANVMLGFGALIILLFDFIWTPFKGLTPEMQGFVILHLPDIFFQLNFLAILSAAIGFFLRSFRWRTGKIELTDEKLVIDGSYHVSIWLKNMWEVDVRDMDDHRWIVRLDSNVDAVQIKFLVEEDFESFSEKLVQIVRDVENIRLKITT